MVEQGRAVAYRKCSRRYVSQEAPSRAERREVWREGGRRASVTLAARRAALRRSSERFRRVLRPPGSGESDIPSIAATGALFAHPLAVFDTRGRAQARKLRPEFGQRLGTMLALAFGPARIEAHHVASAAFSVADDFGGLASGRMQGALCRAMIWTLALSSMTLIRPASWCAFPRAVGAHLEQRFPKLCARPVVELCEVCAPPLRKRRVACALRVPRRHRVFSLYRCEASRKLARVDRHCPVVERHRRLAFLPRVPAVPFAIGPQLEQRRAQACSCIDGEFLEPPEPPRLQSAVRFSNHRAVALFSSTTLLPAASSFPFSTSVRCSIHSLSHSGFRSASKYSSPPSPSMSTMSSAVSSAW